MNIGELKNLQLKIIKKSKLCNIIATIIILIILTVSIITFLSNDTKLQLVLMYTFFELMQH